MSRFVLSSGNLPTRYILIWFKSILRKVFCLMQESEDGLSVSGLGRKSIVDDPLPGAPITAASLIKSCGIKELIDLDPHITIRELSNSVGISMGSVDRPSGPSDNSKETNCYWKLLY
ncbi:hypothetical protein LOD99_5222 [Oopsacas minuta]|uniref:Uncharacterized protein n=1 Tax=Oopsacas minuta TaxID=111878 RepID=A0AAV7JSM9_9METZ|nr:hypothetical protein LOD99_5222 [Oopsacas minuta]